MDPNGEVCRSLVKWLHTLTPDTISSDITDGVRMLEALLRIAPEHFSHLEPKIKRDAGTNWRVKVSNLKKILESVLEYYQDALNVQVSDLGKPDVVRLGETRDEVELGKMVRLVLGCAVHCEKKQEYITQIMCMEESVQSCIMQAIQQLEEVTSGQNKSGLSLLSMEGADGRVYRLMEELAGANEAKEVLSQRCHDLEMQVQSLLEDKQVLASDNEALRKMVKANREPAEGVRSPDVRRQIEQLKEELFKAETTRDDYRAKILELEKELIGCQGKVNELQLQVQIASHLKDEVDALSESAEKVKALEVTLASYKKKLEDYGDLKKQLKYLEDKNVQYVQYNLKCEEELKKLNMWKNQSEIYKNQASDLQQKLDDESQRADKAEFHSKTLETKLTALQSERDRLLQEIDALREETLELKLNNPDPNKPAPITQELTPNELKQRLHYLETENTTLRNNLQETTAKMTLLDDTLKRLEKLQDQNRTSNQRILELELQLEEAQKGPSDATALRQKCAALQESLSAKESELHSLQERYNRSLEKAREVAVSLDSVKVNGMPEMEERLVASAFYNLGLACQREAVDERLALLSAGQGQSFLSRQRQPVSRKSNQNLKSK